MEGIKDSWTVTRTIMVLRQQSVFVFSGDHPLLHIGGRRQHGGFHEEGDLEEALRSPKRRRGNGDARGGGAQHYCRPPREPIFSLPRDRPRGPFGLAVEPRSLERWRTRGHDAVRRSSGKLLLVLDLDETLLHSHAMKDLHPRPVHDPRREFHVVRSLETATKLRPFMREFLRAASAMYDMHIYTMGQRIYADDMAELLDPEGEYFSRVLCRDDCTVERTKRLDAVPGHPSAVVVLDDTPSAWAEADRGNVIHVNKFLWSPHGYNARRDSTLLRMLGLLQRIHADYYSRQGPGRDVREIVRSARREILRGCRLLFADKTSPMLSMGRGQVRRWDTLAEEMGGAVASGLPDATHIICCGEGAAEWAAKNSTAAAVVVDVKWLKKVYFTWERPAAAERTRRRIVLQRHWSNWSKWSG